MSGNPNSYRIFFNFIDFIVTEGDIIVYDDQEPSEYDILEDVITKKDALWHNTFDADSGTVGIPYLIDSNVGSESRKKVKEAIKEFDLKTCIR